VRVLTERMDRVKASPFELGAGDDAALLVHGFTGSPWDVQPLGEALASRGYFVRGLRLPGHGQTPDAMLGVGADDWQQAVLAAVDALPDRRRVFLAGLSMGALLSVLAAAARPDRVAGLALLAPAMRVKKRGVDLLLRAGWFGEVARLSPWQFKDATDIADPEAQQQAPLLRAWPTRRLLDLHEIQRRARAAMAQVRAPALVMTARLDHVVTPDGGEELAFGLRASPRVRLIRLEEGFHVMPRDFGRERVAREVGDFFDRTRREG
jgi:carboxylesterase